MDDSTLTAEIAREQEQVTRAHQRLEERVRQAKPAPRLSAVKGAVGTTLDEALANLADGPSQATFTPARSPVHRWSLRR